MANRSVEKYVKEYQKKYYSDKNNTGAFWGTDIIQVYELYGQDLYESIAKSMEFGFMVGYRRAKREGK